MEFVIGENDTTCNTSSKFYVAVFLNENSYFK